MNSHYWNSNWNSNLATFCEQDKSNHYGEGTTQPMSRLTKILSASFTRCCIITEAQGMLTAPDTRGLRHLVTKIQDHTDTGHWTLDPKASPNISRGIRVRENSKRPGHHTTTRAQHSTHPNVIQDDTQARWGATELWETYILRERENEWRRYEYGKRSFQTLTQKAQLNVSKFQRVYRESGLCWHQTAVALRDWDPKLLQPGEKLFIGKVHENFT
jgi:hypothetical protein